VVNARVDVVDVCVVCAASAPRAARLEYFYRAFARAIVRGTRVVDVHDDARVRVPVR